MKHLNIKRAIIIAGLSFITFNLIAQLISLRSNATNVFDANGKYLLLAILSEFAAFLAMSVPLRDFYRLKGYTFSRAHSFMRIVVAGGLARLISLGELIGLYLIDKKQNIDKSASVQFWLILYGMGLLVLIFMYFIGQIIVFNFYEVVSESRVFTVVESLSLVFSALIVSGAILTKRKKVRNRVRKFLSPIVGAGSISPFSILRELNYSGMERVRLFGGLALAWIFEAGALYFSLQAFNIALPLPVVLFGFTFVRVFLIFAIVPGGLGEIEGGVSLFFTGFGATLAAAASAGIVFHAISFWLPVLLAGFAILMLRRNSSNSGG